MSVNQLIVYQTILTVHKTLIDETPVYIFNKIHSNNGRNTRHPVKFGEKFKGKTERTQQSFCYRGVKEYNKLPVEIAQDTNLETFKRKLKTLDERKYPKINIAVVQSFS